MTDLRNPTLSWSSIGVVEDRGANPCRVRVRLGSTTAGDEIRTTVTVHARDDGAFSASASASFTIHIMERRQLSPEPPARRPL